jgi:hypothetical protein
MSKSSSYAIVIGSIAVLTCCVVSAPEFISDNNYFLKTFIGDQLLSVIGFMMTITLASAANLHLEFNKIEEKFQKVGLTRSRKEVHSSAFWMIGVFATSVVLVIIKPIVCNGPRSEAICNAIAIELLLLNILVLIDLTRTAFGIKADVKSND